MSASKTARRGVIVSRQNVWIAELLCWHHAVRGFNTAAVAQIWADFARAPERG